MTYRVHRAPPQYIEDDWSDQPPPAGTEQQRQQQQQHYGRPPASSLNSRKYIDPWDLENYEYIQR